MTRSLKFVVGILVLVTVFGLRTTQYANERIIPGLDQSLGQPLRIVAFGTSLTALYTWPATLGRRLSICLERPVEIDVVARPGAGSAWALDQTAHVADLLPDIVIIEFAINDADVADGVWPRTSLVQHREILAELQEALPEAGILLITTNPVQGLQRFKRPFLQRYYHLYSDLSEEFGSGLLHLTPNWSGRDLPDGLHPLDSDATEIIVPGIANLIAQSYGQTGACR